MKSIFSIFKRGLEKTTTRVARTIGSIFTGTKVHGASSFEELEEQLIAADFGVPASLRIVGGIRDRYERGAIATGADLTKVAAETVKEILSQRMRPVRLAESGKPTVILMVGVNGSGKTTTIGKLAARFRAENGSIVCRELLGVDADGSPVPTPRGAEFFRKRPCAELVGFAARLLDEFAAGPVLGGGQPVGAVTVAPGVF